MSYSDPVHKVPGNSSHFKPPEEVKEKGHFGPRKVQREPSTPTSQKTASVTQENLPNTPPKKENWKPEKKAAPTKAAPNPNIETATTPILGRKKQAAPDIENAPTPQFGPKRPPPYAAPKPPPNLDEAETPPLRRKINPPLLTNKDLSVIKGDEAIDRLKAAANDPKIQSLISTAEPKITVEEARKVAGLILNKAPTDELALKGAARKELVRKMHPDKFQSSKSEEQTKELALLTSFWNGLWEKAGLK